MRILSVIFLGVLAIQLYSFEAQAADPDNIYQYCQEKINKRGNYDCDCIVEKYYPKKAELEKMYGVPFNDPQMPLMHVTQGCTSVEGTGKHEYSACLNNITLKESKNKFGAERFCTCYKDEWEKGLATFMQQQHAVLDKKASNYLKFKARSACEQKL